MDDKSYNKLDDALNKKSLKMSELQQLINNELVSSVVGVESDKKFYRRYEITLVSGSKKLVYVQMSLAQKLSVMCQKDGK